MALVPKIDPNKIFASNAPTQDKPAAFDNYEKGMDETRKNLGRPTIKQANYLHQTADQKILWIHQNGAGLPYDASIEYAENAVTLKDGELKQLVGGAWVEVKTKALPATAITTASAQNQQQINDFGGAKWYAKVGGYEPGATVKLDNGDTVQSTEAANTVNPNVDMAGWVKIGNLIIVNTVSELVAKNLKNGDVVKTLGYNSLSDNGGAFYVISSTATDYSIPLSNDLHAVFNDDFDIRKFGVISNPTLDQSTALLRMRNYADSRVYEIDFLNFEIMTPKLSAGIKNRPFITGLWFEYAHHYKNLKMLNDKVNRLNFGDCQLIFCPTKDAAQLQNVVYENVTLDPWVSNHQAFTDGYIGFYDGCCHAIFIHPKNDWGALKPYLNKKKTSNYNFEFKNIKFLSSAYSYNITQAGVRANTVKCENISGDCIVGINLDTCNLFAENVVMNVRTDLKEAGRLMVDTVIHYEPENGSSIDAGIIYDYEYIQLKNCQATKYPNMAGQLFWMSPVAVVNIGKIYFENCSGVAEICGGTVGVSNCEMVEAKDCTKDFWLVTYGRSASSTTHFNKIKLKNCSNVRMSANTQFTNSIINVNIDEYLIEDTKIVSGFGYYESSTGKIGKLVIRNCEFLSSTQVGKFNWLSCDELLLDNIKVAEINTNSIFRFLNCPKVIVRDSDFVQAMSMQFRYLEVDAPTELTYDNVDFYTSAYSFAELSGKVNFRNCNFRVAVPATSINSAPGTNGTKLLEKNYYGNISASLFTTQHALSAISIPANGKIYNTYAINSISKSFDAYLLTANNDVFITHTKSGSNLIVCFENRTSSLMTLTNTLVIQQFN